MIIKVYINNKKFRFQKTVITQMQMILIERCTFYLPTAKINIILETCKRLTVFLFLYRLTKLRSFCIILIKFEYHE